MFYFHSLDDSTTTPELRSFSKTTIRCCPRLNVRVHSSKVELAAAGVHPVGMISSHASVYLWTPAQRKRASMLYFANVFYLFIYFFYGHLILRPWLTEVRESFTRGGP